MVTTSNNLVSELVFLTYNRLNGAPETPLLIRSCNKTEPVLSFACTFDTYRVRGFEEQWVVMVEDD